jgi:ubiquitin C-terminal hydrolase
VGLLNLGNTCYLNSAVQCLAHTLPLTRYFLAHRLAEDLNPSSPLGSGGRVARAYERLVKEMWFGEARVCNPQALKAAVTRFSPQFTGHAQHDAHELLVLLLDKLHEDLNRVRQKPYVEAQDLDPARSQAAQAAEAWGRVRARDESVVVDLTWGLLRSTLVCPACGHVSVAFDPFHCLTLEMPAWEGRRRVEVLVWPRVGEAEGRGRGRGRGEGATEAALPRLVVLDLPRRALVRDLKEELEAICGVRHEDLYVGVVRERSLDRFLSDLVPVARVEEGGRAGGGGGLPVEGPQEGTLLAAFEVEGGEGRAGGREGGREEEEASSFLILHHRQCMAASPTSVEGGVLGGREKGEMEMIGFPLLMKFRLEWTVGQFRQQVWREIRRIVAPASDEEERGAVWGELGWSEGGKLLRLVQTDEEGREVAGTREEEEDEEGGKEERQGVWQGGRRRAARPGWREGKDEERGRGRAERGKGGGSQVEEEREEEEEEEEEEEGGRKRLYLPSGVAAEKLRMSDVLAEPENHNAYWMALDWEGALKNRYWGMPLQSRCGERLAPPGEREEKKRKGGREQEGEEGGEEEGEEERDKEEEEGGGAEAEGPRGRGGGAARPMAVFGVVPADPGSPSAPPSLPPSPFLTLDHCLERFSWPERLDRENSWYCSRCREHTAATKTLALWRLPPILILSLKRFDARDRKLDARVVFPVEGWDVGRYCRGEGKTEGGGEDGGEGGGEEGPVYDLFAVSNHFGSRGWGHYTAYARGEGEGGREGQWFRFDDSVCEPVPSSQVAGAGREAYILFYRRREKEGGEASMRSCL